MILTGHEDLRVKRTITAIRNCFSEMLCEMDYARITVKELCDRAQINKKTFYHYYESLDHLLAELQSSYSSEYLKRISQYEIPRDIDKLIRSFFEYSADQNETYEKITCTIACQKIRQDMIDTVMEPTWQQSDYAQKRPPFYRTAILNFWNNSVLDLYKQWIESGKSIPLEDIISLATKLVCQGIYGFNEDPPV